MYFAKQFHIARTAIRRACPADSPVSARAHDPIVVDRSCVPAAPSAPSRDEVPARDRYPDIQVVDISPQALPKHPERIVNRPSRTGKFGGFGNWVIG